MQLKVLCLAKKKFKIWDRSSARKYFYLERKLLFDNEESFVFFVPDGNLSITDD